MLVNLAPWWAAEHSTLALLGAWTLLTGVGLGVGALLSPRLAALSPAGVLAPAAVGAPAGALAPATAGALVAAVDVSLGSPLQRDSPLGWGTLAGARFYGMGNAFFAVLLAGTLAVAAALLARHTRTRGAALATLVTGVAAVVDAHPRLGADFGGVLPLLVGLTVVVVVAHRLRPQPGIVVGLIVAAGGVMTAVAAWDYSRGPASWTHVGAFVQRCLDGGALDVLASKAAASARSLTNVPLAGAAVASVVAGVLAVRRGLHRPALTALLAASLVGLAVNDSGVLIPAVALGVRLPLMSAPVDLRPRR